MTSKTKKKLLSVCTMAVSMTLAGAILCTNLSDTFISVKAAVTLSGTLEDVTDTVSIDRMREQYFDNDIVQKNVLRADDERWVIVGFDGDSIMDTYTDSNTTMAFSEYVTTEEAIDRQKDIAKQHAKFLVKLDKCGIEYEFKYSYSTLNNGVAIKAKRKDIKEISKWADVADVTYSEAYAFPQGAVSNNANVYKTGIYNTEDIDYTGAGMKVAVLDTGLDFTHDAFSTMPKEKTGML